MVRNSGNDIRRRSRSTGRNGVGYGDMTVTQEADRPVPATVGASSEQPLLDVRGLTIDLVGESAQAGLIEDVSFSVPRHGAVALIGESGCGKSLTAMSLLGLLPDAAKVVGGSAMFGDVDLLAAPPRQLRRMRGGPIGMVFQDPMSSLNPTMTVGDQIGEARRLHLGESARTARARAAELLDKVGIPNAARRVKAYPHELSGGMQQRVMIAAAIACDCQLLIADEPTTALDVTIQAEILQLLRDLRQDMGLAVLLVTHDLGVVADFCSDVVVMYAGHVVERSPIVDLHREPTHPYTQALLGAVPRSERARQLLDTIPGRVPPAGEFPVGCRFAPRCAHAVQECWEPQRTIQIAPGRITKCGRVAEGSLHLEGTRHD